jgi:transcriptional regulator with XRE-family HTH domain
MNKALNLTSETSPHKRRRGRTPSGRPNPIDAHVGNRVRLRRTLLGMSQDELAKRIGLTFQQVQKYERGTNRIGASRLFDLARVLDVTVSFFYDDMPEGLKGHSPAAYANGTATELDLSTMDVPEMQREAMSLVRAYFRIKDEKIRGEILKFIKAISHYDGPCDGAA